MISSLFERLSCSCITIQQKIESVLTRTITSILIARTSYKQNMVKNAGGNKGKKMGRKHLGGQRGLRMKQEEGEIYAIVNKIYGGANCEVTCEDGNKRLCIIRNKFRGRGKRGNVIAPGVWVMVGLREWEARAAGKTEKCDLLEVYTDTDKKKLKTEDTTTNWTALISADPTEDAKETAGMEQDGFEWDDSVEKTEEELAMERELQAETEAKAAAKNGKSNVIEAFGDIIDIDDI